MDVSQADISFAKNYCANFGVWYRGPNILNSGFSIEDPEERAPVIEAAWTDWTTFVRNYFMAMLNTLAGHKTFDIEGQIVHSCTPAEALGARTACEVFWKRDLALRGPLERRGGWLFSPVQLAILGDEDVNADVFRTVERSMETAITSTLRTRRSFLSQFDDDVDHTVGFQEDMAHFFGFGRPARLNAKQRNSNFDNRLF